MQCVRQFLQWKANWWESCAKAWGGLDVAIAEGICAYALRQMSIQQSLLTHFVRLWSKPLASYEGEPGEDAALRNLASDMLAEVVAMHSDDDDE
jgi:hypothetical protein